MLHNYLMFTRSSTPEKLQPRQDSNLDQAFRKRLFYPLNYGAPLVNAPEVAPAAAAKMQRIRSLGT